MLPNRYKDDPGARLWPRLDHKENGCWEWAGSVNEHGYGGLRVNSRLIKAHRFAWELTYGPIPEGMAVCHKCDNPPCCNPDHLFLGSQRENAADKLAKGRHQDQSGENSHPTGESHPASKLAWSDVRAIRDSTESISALSRQFGVTRSSIRNIKEGRTWKDNEPPPV